METTAMTEPVEMRVTDVRRLPAEGEEQEPRHVVVLEEVGSNRHLLIWVGPSEGTAMALQLEKVGAPRPLTHTLMASLLEATGARLQEVHITRLADEVFYASAIVEGPSGTRAVDARPSDAINLALATGTTIRADRAVLEMVGVDPEQEQKVAEHSGGAVAEERITRAFAEGVDGASEIAGEYRSRWPTRK